MRTLLDRFRERALDTMSTGSPVEPVLSDLALALQAEIPGSLIGITVLDTPGRTFRLALFPTLPHAFGAALTGQVITGKRGACGLAVVTRQTLEVPDVALDERFSPAWRDLLYAHGLKALRSIPALTQDGQVQGTLAMSHPVGQPPTPQQRTLLDEASRLCATLCRYGRTLETRQLLIGELEHRMRNLFSTVGATAVLTHRRYPGIDAFRRVLEGRLQMMARAHDFAFHDREIELEPLLHELLAPYTDRARLSVSGPRLLLSAQAASAFALVGHELATNAVKYGALSVPTGRLHVTWTVDETPQGAVFSLSWDERQGPLVVAPTRTGYGTRMINGTLRNAFEGGATFTYAPEGLRCCIEAPFSDRLAQSPSSDVA
ncbi:HWE histidine kinase domain-containing protein [Enterobacterales bacterium AW_CKDN230030176-1A_HGKHYDSX7]